MSGTIDSDVRFDARSAQGAARARAARVADNDPSANPYRRSSLPYVPGVELSMKPLRVVLADDHHFFREGLRGMLAADGISVVAEATDGDGAVAVTREHEPDVVVIDLRMPGSPGVDAVRRIVAAQPGAHVIVLTVSAEQSDVLEALAAGACCYLLKDTRVDELVASIRLAAAGHAVLSREIVRALAAQVPTGNQGLGHLDDDGPALSARELEVIRLITEGADNATIGRELSISGHTVKQHVTSIFGKLGVQNRVQVAVRAVRAGLV
jgi:DNA-binding NarL/FixJ family response regulator